MKLNLDILEEQHLVGKFKLLELLDRISPYKNAHSTIERRLSYSINNIPEQFQIAAFTLFGTTIYVTEQMLYSCWNYLWNQVKLKYNVSIEDTLVLELDRDQLRDEFYRSNLLIGRLQDNIPIRSTHDIIDILIKYEESGIPEPIKQILIENLKKNIWIVLIDISISGASTLSELIRLQKIAELVNSKPQILALIQLTTDQSYEELNRSHIQYLYGIKIPYSCAFNHGSYNLITDSGLKTQMDELCRWFGDTHVLTSKYRLAKMSQELNDKDIAYYGFGKLGWNIVTYKNTPNNSLPILWFTTPDGSYISPFERIDSRIKGTWSGRKDFIARLDKDNILKERISKLLS